MDRDDFVEEAGNDLNSIRYDFSQIYRAQNSTPVLFSSFTFQDAEESMHASLDIYQSSIRPLINDIHSFSDSVTCAEHLNALCQIGEYDEWHSILTHAYLADFQYVGMLFDEWQRKTEKTYQAILKEREKMLSIKGSDSLLAGIDARLQNCKSSIQNINELYCKYQKHDFDFFVNKANEKITEAERYVKGFLSLG